MPAPAKKAIMSRLPGFFFGPGDIFPIQISEQIYLALLGDFRDISRQEGLVRTRASITELFRAAMNQAFMYQAVRGGLMAWEMISKDTILHCELDAHQTQVAVETFLAARRAYTGMHSDSITALVDQFAHVVNHTATLGPVQTLTLAVHSGNPAAIAFGSAAGGSTASAESTAIIESLAAAMRDLNIQHSWPPAYFNERQLQILARAPITRVLAGVDPNHPHYATDTPAPIASCRGPPLGIQIALCRRALTHYSASADWTLFLSPVGFKDRATSEAWFNVLGPNHSKPFATIPSFLHAAAEALTKRGKRFAVGMLTNWFFLPASVAAAASAAGVKPSEKWLNGVRTQRFASVLIMRRVLVGETESKDDMIQVIWYDPWKHEEEVKTQAKPHATGVFAYRATIVHALEQWLQESTIRYHSWYCGGYGSRNPDIQGDPVKFCLAFIEKITSGQSMEEVFPDPEDEDGFNQMGFELAN
ncbi:hypothetical protein QBC39DRAFT_265947 [Podospora conica]|nr:hypothetical protein QBC39DRAFT_265947 [Schizothecium conicum]